MLIYESSCNLMTLIIQCTLVALRTWNKVEERGKSSMSFTKIMQSPRETFTNFLHRLTYAMDRAISDPDVRQVLIEPLAFKNANAECKESS